MINDMIKIFADEPEKVEKAVLRCVKVLINILIAASLYKLIVGPFYLFALDSYSEWENFLLSGRVLVCLLFYFLSEYILFKLLTIPGYLLSRLVLKIEGPKHGDIQPLLKMFGIFKYDKEKDVVVPGRNIDMLILLSKAFAEEESKSEIEALRSTFISNVLDLYSSFVIVYLIILPENVKTSLLTGFLLVVLVIILIIHAGIHGMIEYMSRHYEDILNSLSFVKINGIMYNVLGSFGIFPLKPKKGEGIGKCRVFNRSGKEYILVPPITDKRMLRRGDQEIESLLQKRQKPDRVFIVIVQELARTNSVNFQAKYQNELILIEYKDENDLRSQMNSTLMRII